MSIYNETTVPITPAATTTKQKQPLLLIKDYFAWKKYCVKDYGGRSTLSSEIPLYVDDGSGAVHGCDSTACTIMQYSLLTACSLGLLALITYYSYVGYQSRTQI
ncbi:ORF149 [Betabaculovirus altermyunipunctae]|uniref:ORF149 n=1 Tax=Betabaculovirus altermyunipunctae TaxID=3051996 RepID=A0A1S5YE79_9BBAC|nr:ORF149 [Betabaculovirus altermyunipunctae]AQQ80415.1 ORF149 [Betabaculovirus altermyunipunctae]